MQFDKWFNKQSTLVKVLLLVIPVVNWVVEILVRFSIALRTKDIIHVAIAIIFAVVGVTMVLEIIDLVCLLLTDRLFLSE